ncbi:MAG: hypothetical protein ABR600_04220 [Actinomycetota bacterium]
MHTGPYDPDVITAHLGQFTRETANAIAGQLEEAGIVWWYKEPGWLSSLWEQGVRLFVDERRMDEAKEIVERLKGGAPGSDQA